MSRSTLEASEDTKGVELKIQSLGIYWDLFTLFVMQYGARDHLSTNKLLSYAQFCLH